MFEAFPLVGFLNACPWEESLVIISNAADQKCLNMMVAFLVPLTCGTQIYLPCVFRIAVYLRSSRFGKGGLKFWALTHIYIECIRKYWCKYYCTLTDDIKTQMDLTNSPQVMTISLFIDCLKLWLCCKEMGSSHTSNCGSVSAVTKLGILVTNLHIQELQCLVVMFSCSAWTASVSTPPTCLSPHPTPNLCPFGHPAQLG